MKILVIGKPTYNVILPVNNFVIEGSKNQLTGKLEMGGGASFYAASLMAKWGAEVAYTGVIGSDPYGNKIKADLEALNVDTKYVEINYENPTSFNYLIVNAANGSSTQMVIDDPNVTLQKYKYDFTPEFLIMDGTDLAGSMAAINNFPQAKSIVLANRVSEDIYSLTKRATHVIANTNFAKALTKLELEVDKPKALVNFMQKIKDLQKAEYIITMRDHGVLYTSEQQVKMIPSIAIEKKVDDTNAGNMFFAAFCYGLINNYNIDQAVRIANITAGLALTKLGSVNSIPELSEVLNLAGIEAVSSTVTDEGASEQPSETVSTESTSSESVAETVPVSTEVPASPENAFGDNAVPEETTPTNNE